MAKKKKKPTLTIDTKAKTTPAEYREALAKFHKAVSAANRAYDRILEKEVPNARLRKEVREAFDTLAQFEKGQFKKGSVDASKEASKQRTAKANAPCKCCNLTRNQYWNKTWSKLEGSELLEKSRDQMADEATAKHFGIQYESMKKFRYKRIKTPS